MLPGRPKLTDEELERILLDSLKKMKEESEE
jgi:hypothetical protein